MNSVCIIGAGVVGCAIARELSKYELDITILEKENDVSMGATKANSGIIHAGYGTAPGSLKTLLCVKGNALYDRLEEELNFGFRRCGSLVLGFTQEERAELEKLLASGKENNVGGLEIIGRDALLGLDPGINPDVTCALYAPSAGVASPYELAIAFAENSLANGAAFIPGAEVKRIIRDGKIYHIETAAGNFESDVIINSAGLFSDIISAMAGFSDFSIKPRKGQYLIFDRWSGLEINHVLFQVPGKMGKGVLVTPTYHNNLMIGPDALNIDSRYDYLPDREALLKILEVSKISYLLPDPKKLIRTFSGIRAVSSTGDFVIASPAPGFINTGGIDSPGLTSSPAIALLVKGFVEKYLVKLEVKKDFNPHRDPIIKERLNLPSDEVEHLIKLPDTSDERIVCRCEQVRQSVILDSLRRGIKITSTDGVKRRTRAGMGRCQGAFCRKRVRALIAREYGMPEESIAGPDRESYDIMFLKRSSGGKG
ncbi:MAG: NAD(P)/FAD-dependent oxidoreductase [Spirochaetia bacterium]|jgi:glycerol-3-phosphate dehydrogenase|nr:NAD(P)/FAD-dependent oxidoreductase [Spirochaetia bacterium]